MNALFIGVVSHERSRFQESQGPDGLANRLAHHLKSHGVSCTVAINTADLFTGQINPEMVKQSLDAQVVLESDWSTYLESPQVYVSWARHLCGVARNAFRRRVLPSTGTIRRLLNIELSHMDLLQRALRSGASWALILEDDAESKEIVDLADGLIGIMHGSETQPAYVNLSRSFSVKQLRIAHLLTPSPDTQWQGSCSRVVFTSRKAVTNTVCAILYRSAFLTRLVPALEALPIEPVVPIDWKMNQALMALEREGAISEGECWLVEPPPISQLSMHDHD